MLVQNISFDDVLVRATLAGRVAGRPDVIMPGVTLGSVSVTQLLAAIQTNHLTVPRFNVTEFQTAIRTYQQEMPHGDDTYI